MSGHVSFVPLASEVRRCGLWLSASSLSPPSIFTASQKLDQLRPLKMEWLQCEPGRTNPNNIQFYISTVEVTVAHISEMKLLFHPQSRWSAQIGLTGLLSQPIVHHFSIYPPLILTALMYHTHVCFDLNKRLFHPRNSAETRYKPRVQARPCGLLEPSYSQSSCTKAVFRSLPTWTRLLE